VSEQQQMREFARVVEARVAMPDFDELARQGRLRRRRRQAGVVVTAAVLVSAVLSGVPLLQRLVTAPEPLPATPPHVRAASTVSSTDGRGDMWQLRTQPQDVPAPEQRAGDITDLRVAHAHRAVWVYTNFVELRRSGHGLQLEVRLRTDTGIWQYLALLTGAESKAGWSGTVEITARSGRVVNCPVTHEVDYSNAAIRLRIPRSCLDNPRWLQTSVASVSIPDEEDRTMFVDDALTTSQDRHPWSRRIPHG
jgi:hypothetical protein